MVISKVEPTVLHSLEIPKGMVLFFLQGSQDPFAERIGSIWELEQSECHELDGKEFMVGEEMEQNTTLFFIVDLISRGERRFSVVRFWFKVIGTPGKRRSDKTASFWWIKGQCDRSVGKFVPQRSGHQHPFGEFEDILWFSHSARQDFVGISFHAKKNPE